MANAHNSIELPLKYTYSFTVNDEKQMWNTNAIGELEDTLLSYTLNELRWILVKERWINFRFAVRIFIIYSPRPYYIPAIGPIARRSYTDSGLSQLVR